MSETTAIIIDDALAVAETTHDDIAAKVAESFEKILLDGAKKAPARPPRTSRPSRDSCRPGPSARTGTPRRVLGP